MTNKAKREFVARMARARARARKGTKKKHSATPRKRNAAAPKKKAAKRNPDSSYERGFTRGYQHGGSTIRTPYPAAKLKESAFNTPYDVQAGLYIGDLDPKKRGIESRRWARGYAAGFRKAKAELARSKNPRRKPRKATARKRNAKKITRRTAKKELMKHGGFLKAIGFKVKDARAAIAQHREIKKKYSPKAQAKKRANPKRRRNQAGAAELYESFHQRPHNREIDYEIEERYHSQLAELGWLVELRILDAASEWETPLKFSRSNGSRVQVTATADGSNIYFVGGDQSVPTEGLSGKDYVTLGECTSITYHTVKGFHDFAPTDYEHDFGEETGELPTLNYDRLNKRLFLIGGDFFVKPEGIVN
jgi:hypothetical protein